MLFSEIVRMAWSSLGANKLRSALTMLGITIGVFSVISVMTAIGALQYSIENGISFLGSNIFQFGKEAQLVSDLHFLVKTAFFREVTDAVLHRRSDWLAEQLDAT